MFFVSLIVGCTGRTEVVVGVVTDLKARGQLDLVKFVAARNGTPLVEHEWSLADVPAGNYELPGSFGLYSDSGSEPRVELSVIGYKGAEVVVDRESILSLLSGQTLFVRMGLVGDCAALNGPTCGAAESCVEGVCRPRALDARRLPAFRSELVKSVECSTGIQYVVSSTGAPMTATGKGCSGNQFCQEGTCYNLLAGEDGGVGQGLWVDVPTPVTAALHATWGTLDGADIFAVGDRGTILHQSSGGPSAASAWVPETSGTTANLYGVWGWTANNVYAVGAGGVIVHRTTQWDVETAPSVATLEAAYGFGPGDVWAVGRTAAQSGVVLHRTGGAWVIGGSAPAPLHAVWGGARDDVWAVGSTATEHFDGTLWSPVTAPPMVDLHGVGGFGSLVFVVGRHGYIGRADTSGVTDEVSGVTSDLFAVWAGSPTDIYAVGDGGVILYSKGDGKWSPQASGTTAPLFTVWGAGMDLFAAGRDGHVLHNTGVGGPAPCLQPSDCPTACNGDKLTTPTCNAGLCVPQATAPCASGLVCADTVACKTACGADSDCQAAFYCKSDGTCAPSAQQAGACDSAACKQSGCRLCVSPAQCVDGFCCDAACAGQCEACDVKGAEGNCTPVPSGPPHATRAACAGGGTVCQGACDGSSRTQCTYPTSECGTSSCDTTSNNYTRAYHTCKDGACQATTQTTSCEPFSCQGGTCGSSCVPLPSPSVQPDCASDFPQCPGGYNRCIVYNGGQCTKDAECLDNNYCTGGYCCSSQTCAPNPSCSKDGNMNWVRTVSSCSLGYCAPSTSFCPGNFACIGTDCLTTCNTPADCRSASYVCVAHICQLG